MTDTAPLPTPPHVPPWAPLLEYDYLALRTRRLDGSTVATPMWFATTGSGLVLRTPAGSAKVRRLRSDDRVAVHVCDWRGRTLGGEWVEGRAAILTGDDAEAANRSLHARYGWKWNVVPMIPVPGVTSAHRGLPLRDRLRLARHRNLWPNSVIVRIDLG